MRYDHCRGSTGVPASAAAGAPWGAACTVAGCLLGPPAYKAKAIAVASKIAKTRCLNIRASSLRGRAPLRVRSCFRQAISKLKQTVKFVGLLMYHPWMLPVNRKNDSRLEPSGAGVE